MNREPATKQQEWEAANVLHELRVHQTELEVQNRELRESREALEGSRARYADLFDFAPIGYLTLDTAGRVLEINLCGAALLGHERPIILGKPFRVLVRLEQTDAMSAHIRECIARRETVRAELAFVRKRDEAHLCVQAISTPLVGVDGSPVGCRTALVDLTEHKRLERERERALERERLARANAEQARSFAEQATRLKDEFLSVVSHELRTPLNAILGWAHMLTSLPASDPAKFKHGLEVIRRNAEAQQRLVEDILDTSRIIRGKLNMELRGARLADIVGAAVENAHPAASAKCIELTFRANVDPQVLADPERMQQVMWNLLSNAIKFTPPQGRVDVVIDRRERSAFVSVRDTGAGITNDALPWIFDRFRQVDSSPARLHGGLGLGLAIVRHIMELHGGRVWGESGGPGKGATFVIELPMTGSGETSPD